MGNNGRLFLRVKRAERGEQWAGEVGEVTRDNKMWANATVGGRVIKNLVLSSQDGHLAPFKHTSTFLKRCLIIRIISRASITSMHSYNEKKASRRVIRTQKLKAWGLKWQAVMQIFICWENCCEHYFSDSNVVYVVHSFNQPCVFSTYVFVDQVNLTSFPAKKGRFNTVMPVFGFVPLGWWLR